MLTRNPFFRVANYIITFWISTNDLIHVNKYKIKINKYINYTIFIFIFPCPCGYFNHPEKQCTCPPGAVQKYLNKISGPLLDRIDLHVEVTPVAFSELLNMNAKVQEKSESIRERVLKARAIQGERYKDSVGIYANAQISSKQLQSLCVLTPAGQNLLKKAMERLNLSARAYDRILKVSRTIADLEGSDEIKTEHLAEAIQYRSLDRESWGA